jgi:hypothetical protein
MKQIYIFIHQNISTLGAVLHSVQMTVIDPVQVLRIGMLMYPLFDDCSMDGKAKGG